MKNCLVTKLKRTVDNPNLALLGELPVVVNSSFSVSSQQQIKVRANKNAISLTENGTPTNEITIEPDGSPTPIYVMEECIVFLPYYYIAKLFISPIEDINVKYYGYKSSSNFIQLTIQGTNSVNLGELPINIKYADLGDCTIKLSADTYPNLTNFTTGATNKKQLINLVEIKNKMPSLQIFYVYVPAGNYTGTVEDLGGIKTLTNITGLTISGAMENFVAAQRQSYSGRAGRTTGSVSLKWCRNFTFQGVDNLVLGTAKTLSWTATTITFDGTTIDA